MAVSNTTLGARVVAVLPIPVYLCIGIEDRVFVEK